ncbi:conserved hypothetical protein [Vibrio phage 275E43-1]|nr:conserved hypothetical protein [Vibrio phage 275E43-1]
MNDETLSEEEREVYASMYAKMSGRTDEEAARERAQIEAERQAEIDAVGIDVEDCEGGACKI